MTGFKKWISALGGFLFTYNTTVIAGALIFLHTQFSLTPFQEGMVVSTALFGAMLSSCFAGSLSNRIGRKRSLIVSTVLFLIGAFLSALAPSYFVLLLGRLSIGLGAGIMTVVLPLYLSEMASPENRGSSMQSYQVAIALGSLTAYLVNYLFSYIQAWRLMLAIGGIYAALHLFGLLFISESPYWKKDHSIQTISWRELLKKNYRPHAWLGFALVVFQQIVGVNAVIFFAPRLLYQSEAFSPSQATFASVAISIVNGIVLVSTMNFIDRVGRRSLFIFSLGGVALSLIAICLALWLQPTFDGVLLTIFFMAYTLFYALGLGPLPPLIVAEIFPPVVRAHAMALIGFSGWILNYLVALTFPLLVELFSTVGTFLIYLLSAFLALWFVIKKLPETKGKTPEEIGKSFNNQ